MKRNNETRVLIKRRRSKLAWLLGTTAVVIGLLYWELAGLLYVLATLAMVALFIVVAFADLETGHHEIDGNEG